MEKKVEFKVKKETLRGSLFVPEGKGPFPGVVFFHGSGGIGEMYFEAAEKLSQKGILGFAFNYRGAGVSDGEFEEQTLEMGITDAKAALEFFRSQPEVDRKRLGISGTSFGGFLAALIVDSNVKSLILVGPTAYSPKELNNQRNQAGDLTDAFVASESFKNISRYKGKLLMVTSEFDDVIPTPVIQEYLKKAELASKIEEYVLKGAKHRISINPSARKVLIQKITDWFLETL